MKPDGITKEVKSYPLNINFDANFRFEGDFSNKYLYDKKVFDSNSSSLTFSYDSEPTTTGENGTDGFAQNSNELAGSKYIKSFTNNQIGLGEARLDGFINCISQGFARELEDGNQIGGFKVTNQNGVTYHFALPVYSYDEYSYSERIDKAGKTFFNHSQKPGRYAYTWLLTAVTGPDFVDRNGNGLVDASDWGYWVSFEYGKWAKEFGWRNPSEGFNSDIDESFNSFSKGKKELYYLNYIKTATHTAIFVKEIRPDGKGATSLHNEAVLAGSSITYKDTGGFETIDTGGRNIIYPTSTLRLSKIYLVKNENIIGDLPALQEEIRTGDSNHLRSNVIDNNDISNVQADLENSSIRSIDLNHNYTLCQGVSNSFYSQLDIIHTSNSADPVETKRGKLTLESIQVNGKRGIGLVPPTSFSYDIENQNNQSATINSIGRDSEGRLTVNVTLGTELPNQLVDELVKFNQSEIEYVGSIIQAIENNNLDIRLINTVRPNLGAVMNFQLTKNPPYNKDAYDNWGMYKSDFLEQDFRTIFGFGEEPASLSHLTTSTSAKSTDVWSLREIRTSLGSSININYESDTYVNALKDLSNLLVKQVEIESQSPKRLRLTFYNNSTTLDLQIGSSYQVEFLFRRKGVALNNFKVKCGENDLSELYIWNYFKTDSRFPTATVRSVGSDFIIIEDDALFTEISKPSNQLLLIDRSTFEVAHPGENEPSYIFDVNELVAGQLITNAGLMSNYGGGVRVKSIGLTASDLLRETIYDYSNGVTSYEPVGFQLPVKRIDPNYSSCIKTKENEKVESFNSQSYFKNTIGKYLEVFSKSRELPSPGVFYGKVKVSELISHYNGIKTQAEGFTEYLFDVFSPNLVNLIKIPPDNQPVVGFLNKGYNSIEDFTSRIGNLKSITQYKNDGNKIDETKFIYLHDAHSTDETVNLLNQDFNSQGVLIETFVDARNVLAENGGYTLLGVVSQRKHYPSVQIAQEHLDFKTGILTTVKNEMFDFYSGEVIKSTSTDAYGNAISSETVPAYRAYPEMGLMALDHSKKNMLTQTAANYNFIINNVGVNIGLLSASIQSWSNTVSVLGQDTHDINIWRQQDSYQWNGQQGLQADGTYPIADFSPFNFETLASNTKWEKTGGITLYDTYSHALEATDINGNFASTRMDPMQRFVTASTANASYGEMAYSGMEFSTGNAFNEGGVERGNGSPSQAHAHTGRYSLLTGFSKTGFRYTLNPTKADLKKLYRASVWVYVPGEAETQPELDNIQLVASVNGVDKIVHPVLQKNKSKSWYQMNLDFDPQGQETVIKCVNNSSRGVYFDDFRVHPIDANMTSYVYDNFSGELNFILDANNFYTHFEYDAMGRLIRTSREMLNFDFGPDKESFKADRILNEVIYNYGKSN